MVQNRSNRLGVGIALSVASNLHGTAAGSFIARNRPPAAPNQQLVRPLTSACGSDEKARPGKVRREVRRDRLCVWG